MSKTLIVICEHRVEVPETFTLGHQTCERLKADIESTPQPGLSKYLHKLGAYMDGEVVAVRLIEEHDTRQ